MPMGGKPTEGGPGPVVKDGQVLESSTPATDAPRAGHCEDCPVADDWDVAHGVRCGTCDRLLTKRTERIAADLERAYAVQYPPLPGRVAREG